MCQEKGTNHSSDKSPAVVKEVCYLLVKVKSVFSSVRNGESPNQGYGFFAQPQASIRCTRLLFPSALGSAPHCQAGSGVRAAAGFQACLHLHVPCSHDVGNPYGCIRDFG